MFIKILHEIKRYLEYLFVIIFFFLSRLIGINLSSLLGGTVFSLYGLFSKRNSIALSNLEKVFPNKKLKETVMVSVSSDTFHQLLDNEEIEDIQDDMQLDAGFGD